VLSVSHRVAGIAGSFADCFLLKKDQTMNRTQLAGFALIASAFVMAALLVNKLPARLESEARANFVVNRDNFTMMTARTRADEEALFVLENGSQKLLIYTMDIGHRRLNPVGFADLSIMFNAATPQGGGKAPR